MNGKIFVEESLITKEIEKYNLKDFKDLPTAIKDIMLMLGKSFQSPLTTDNEKKVRNRILNSLKWRCDNRAFEDDSSDSDVPLAEVVTSDLN
uniref:Uncharacterized protein n=1 Tax=Magallana gigas TaxID=29159 RepID=A0A8W8LSU1_MAGGI